MAAIATCITLVWLYGIVVIILAIIRRNRFPIKAKNLTASILQYSGMRNYFYTLLVGILGVTFVMLHNYLPCGLYWALFVIMLPLYDSFNVTRVCLGTLYSKIDGQFFDCQTVHENQGTIH